MINGYKYQQYLIYQLHDMKREGIKPIEQVLIVVVDI